MELLDRWNRVNFDEANSFMERVALIEELLADIGQAMNDILGDDEPEHSESAVDSYPLLEKDWLDEISGLLAALHDREGNLFKAPR
ncbi:MAG: hypothetical protein J7J32_02620, partial [Candidatus Atribacteria bacterium]|nr:hypothetical protein [Candidatus Atribacteria bacterium]MCD6349767.1 hypothetical protein [Candidatus Atribacteria bacterium]